MTRLRQKMLEELQRRNYHRTRSATIESTVADFARHFRKIAGQTRSGSPAFSTTPIFSRDRKLAVESVVAV